ncbi:MAG: transposase [Acidobacteria bacterium]|nr:transposase [Acidobacteriota bacterium]
MTLQYYFKPKCPFCGSHHTYPVGESAIDDLRRLWGCSDCNRSWLHLQWLKIIAMAILAALVGQRIGRML